MSPTIFEKNYTELQGELKFLTNTQYEQEEVSNYIDSIQHTPDELEALKDLLYHYHTSKMTGEWEPFNKGIMIGDFDKDLQEEEYLRMLDRQEMLGDMYAFEDENETHEVLSMNPWESRNHISDYGKLNKRSEITIDATVTHVGNNYSTATSKYGKIFIPKPCGLMLPNGRYDDKNITIRARFQGFDKCRISTMPWRAIAIIKHNY